MSFLLSRLGGQKTTFGSLATCLLSRTLSTTLPRSSKALPSEPALPAIPLPTPSLKGKDIMSVVREENLARLDPSGARTAMVDRSSPTRLRPGDTVRVTSHRSMTHPTSTLSFSGIILAISRRGPESTITIRNIVQQLGVEMRYPVYSPMVKAIDVLARGKGYRRAKLYYLRDQPGKTFSRVSRKAMSKQ